MLTQSGAWSISNWDVNFRVTTRPQRFSIASHHRIRIWFYLWDGISTTCGKKILQLGGISRSCPARSFVHTLKGDAAFTWEILLHETFCIILLFQNTFTRKDSLWHFGASARSDSSPQPEPWWLLLLLLLLVFRCVTPIFGSLTRHWFFARLRGGGEEHFKEKAREAAMKPSDP